MTTANDIPPGTGRCRRRVRAVALALALAGLTMAGPALADPADDGSMHPDETATTYRAGDDATIAFWCAQEMHATKVAVEGLEQLYRQTELGNCTARPIEGLEVVLQGFMSGPYWFGDDRTPWSLWTVSSEEHADPLFALVPDNTGPHARDKTNL